VSVVNDSRIIVTKRAKELAIALVLMGVTMVMRSYPLDPKTGWWLGQGVFIVVFALTYLREERRAFHPSYSKVIVRWNRAEEIVFTLTVAALYLAWFVFHMSLPYFYAWVGVYVIGLLSGLLAGELVWQHLRLHQMEHACRERYWATYIDSLISF
jgi:hypothetical protein